MSLPYIVSDDGQLVQVVSTCRCHIVRTGASAVLIIDPGALDLKEVLSTLKVTQVEAVILTRVERRYSQALWETHQLRQTTVYASEAGCRLLHQIDEFWQRFEQFHLYASRPGYDLPLKPLHSVQPLTSIQSGTISVHSLLTTGDDELLLLKVVATERMLLFCGSLVSSEGHLPEFHQLEHDYNEYCMGDAAAVERHRDRAERLSIMFDDTTECYSSHGSGSIISPSDLMSVSTGLESLLALLKAPQKQTGCSGSAVLGQSLYSVSTTICLISSTGNVLLYDYGWPEEGGLSIFDELVRLTGRDDLTAHTLVVSHYHDDHVAGIPSLRRRFPQLRCIGHALHADIISNPWDYALPCLGTAGYPENGLIEFDVVYEGTAVFDWFEYHCTILPFPGQSRYHTALVTDIGSSRVLFAGDSVLPPVASAPFRGESSNCSNKIFYQGRIGYLECADVLSAYRPDYIASAHHGIFSVTEDDIHAYRQWAFLLDDQLRQLCRDHQSPSLCYDPAVSSFYPFSHQVKEDQVRVSAMLMIEHVGGEERTYDIRAIASDMFHITIEPETVTVSGDTPVASCQVTLKRRKPLETRRYVISAVVCDRSDPVSSQVPCMFIELERAVLMRKKKLYHLLEEDILRAVSLPREHRIAWMTFWQVPD